MDLAAIGSLLGSLKTATDIAKFIRESDVSIEKAETKLKLAELVSALADAKIEAADVQQSILERDELIRKLEAEAKLRAELIWKQPRYVLVNPSGEEESFCQNCYDSEKRLSRLHTDERGGFECRVCKQFFKTNERREIDSRKVNAAMASRRSSSWTAR